MFNKQITAIRNRVSSATREELTNLVQDIKTDISKDVEAYIPMLHLTCRLIGVMVAMKTWKAPETPAPRITYKLMGETHIHH